ncbi:MAG: hypothetical protein ACR2QC_08875 [Gammaproteobacteria bacterium]
MAVFLYFWIPLNLVLSAKPKSAAIPAKAGISLRRRRNFEKIPKKNRPEKNSQKS